MLDRNVTQCYETLRENLIHKQIAQLQPPRILTAAIKEQTNSKVDSYLHRLRVSISKGLVACEKVPNCSNETSIADATTNNPMSYVPIILKNHGQTESSYHKQSCFKTIYYSNRSLSFWLTWIDLTSLCSRQTMHWQIYSFINSFMLCNVQRSVMYRYNTCWLKSYATWWSTFT